MIRIRLLFISAILLSLGSIFWQALLGNTIPNARWENTFDQIWGIWMLFVAATVWSWLLGEDKCKS